MSHPVVAPPLEFLRETGEDGIQYIIRPFEWSLDAAEMYYRRFQGYHIFSDDIPKTPESFIAYVGLAGTLWFEGVRADTEENVGFVYLTDMQPSWTDKRFLSAFFHAVTWDAKAAWRQAVAKAFIRRVFKVFGLHRLQAAVPMKYGGAMRTLKKLGFVEEGRLVKARKYDGVWFDVLLLSIVEDELNGHRRQGLTLPELRLLQRKDP